MKKAVTLFIIALLGAVCCFPQPANSGSTDPSQGCQAFFSYYHNDSIKTFAAAHPYNFIDQSYGDVLRWNWDFGDGFTSTERNPLHFYSTAGDTVRVCLSITTSDSCKSRYCTMFVVGPSDFPPFPPCLTSFTTEVMESYPPQYRFVPALTQSTISCQWDFGDGSFSTEISPSHRYEFSGTYLVGLTMTFTNGCTAFAYDTLQATGYDKECRASWIAYPFIYYDSLNLDLTDNSFPTPDYSFYFQDLSKGDILQWSWTFGDGTSSNEQSPSHTFAMEGVYDVCLGILTADSCESSYCSQVVVGSPVIPTDCKADFSITMIKTNPPFYQFIPDTTDMWVSYYWDFGDGSFSSEVSPVHQYEYDGKYPVNLNMIFPDGCSAFKFDTLLAVGHNNECKAGWIAYTDLSTPSGGLYNSDTAYWPSGHYCYFQDQSKGNVIQWNWNFGDGTGSKEPNPVHVYNENGIYHVCLEISTYNNCTSTYCDTLFVGTVPFCSLTGTVADYTGLDGCGLVIELDNGERLEPAEIVPNFVLKEGQRVRLSYTELMDMASICMVGKIVRIDCITEILRDSCKASFTYYALPWISSWPPMYQFEDQSYGSRREIVWDLGDGTITSEFSPVHRYQYSGYYNICLTIYSFDGCSDSYCQTAYFEGTSPQQGLCENYIRLTTDVVLNGQTCNGSATAGLVDKDGNEALAAEYLWSTGETGPAIYNLCPGWTYSVTVTDATGCAVSGSFYFDGGNGYPDSLVGYWNYQQDNMNFVFNLPIYSDSVYCRWDFGDGSTADGSSVSHTYESGDEKTVVVEVYDLDGNLLYGQEIVVTPENATGIEETTGNSPEVYPVPADDVLYLRLPGTYSSLERIELCSAGGQLILATQGVKQGDKLFQVDVSALPAGFYMGRVICSDGSMHSFRFVK